jgi:protein-S-isoprenylcysteine O-methyltransferase Ste14
MLLIGTPIVGLRRSLGPQTVPTGSPPYGRPAQAFPRRPTASASLENARSWRTALAALFFVLASVWSWTGVRALGRHLRFDAALSQNHKLVRSGAYRWLRHPIYTSMFCMLLGTAFLFTVHETY